MQLSLQTVGLVGLSVVGLASTFLVLFHRKATLYKISLFFRSFAFILKSQDMNWKNKSIDKQIDNSDAVSSTTKTLLLLRHGESTWNVTFNRSKNPIFFIPRLIFAGSYELILLLRGVRDSWFYDAPLCHEGIEQSQTLAAALKALPPMNEDNRLLHIANASKNTPPSVIVSSNLRRSLSTAVIGLFDRLSRTEENIFVHHSLQEISRNPDTLSITPAKLQPHPSWIESGYPLDIPKMYELQLHVQDNTGNKHIHQTGLHRLNEFNDWLFSSFKEEYVIVSGHSLWFRHYFREFLPVTSTHKGKDKKIRNNGIIGINVTCTTHQNGEQTFVIDESSIKEVYLGFDE